MSGTTDGVRFPYNPPVPPIDASPGAVATYCLALLEDARSNLNHVYRILDENRKIKKAEDLLGEVSNDIIIFRWSQLGEGPPAHLFQRYGFPTDSIHSDLEIVIPLDQLSLYSSESGVSDKTLTPSLHSPEPEDKINEPPTPVHKSGNQVFLEMYRTYEAATTEPPTRPPHPLESGNSTLPLKTMPSKYYCIKTKIYSDTLTKMGQCASCYGTKIPDKYITIISWHQRLAPAAIYKVPFCFRCKKQPIEKREISECTECTNHLAKINRPFKFPKNYYNK